MASDEELVYIVALENKIHELEDALPSARLEVENARIALANKEGELLTVERDLRQMKKELQRRKEYRDRQKLSLALRPALLYDVNLMKFTSSVLVKAVAAALKDVLNNQEAAERIVDFVVVNLNDIYNQLDRSFHNRIRLNTPDGHRLEIIVTSSSKYYVICTKPELVKQLYANKDRENQIVGADTRIAMFEINAKDAKPAARPVMLIKFGSEGYYTTKHFSPPLEAVQALISYMIGPLMWSNIHVGSVKIERTQIDKGSDHY